MRILPLLILGAGAYWYFSGSAKAAEDAPPDAVSFDPVPDFNDGVDVQGYYMDGNLSAFLAMIRKSETGRSDDGAYMIFYGGSTFANLADHPALTGEKAGVPLSDAMCKGAGLGPGCVSTAAGAYQINKPTWNDVRQDKGDGFGYLADFSPASQDIAAVRLLRKSGAVDQLMAGDFSGAVTLASGRWASLAGSTSGQAQHGVQTLLSWFADFGGAVSA